MGAFGSLVLQVLQRVIGRFVDLRGADLALSLWSGGVEMRNVAVRADLLTRLGLALRVREGLVRRLKIEVPWKNLWREPVKIVLDGVVVRVAADLHPAAEPAGGGAQGAPRPDAAGPTTAASCVIMALSSSASSPSTASA